MTNGKRLWAVFFGCFCVVGLCLAQSDLSDAPSLLPEENTEPVIEPQPVESPLLQPLTDDQPVSDNSLQTPSEHAGKTKEQLLSEVRDVYSPEKPSWWPLAPGWWLLGGVFIVLVGLLIRWLYRYLNARRRHDWKKTANAEHQRLCELAVNNAVPSTAIIAEASVLMRRVCLAQFPRDQVASLTDDQWLDVLDNLSNSKEYSQGVGSMLTRHPYMRPHDIASAEVDKLLMLIKQTISHAPSTLGQGVLLEKNSSAYSMKSESGIV